MGQETAHPWLILWPRPIPDLRWKLIGVRVTWASSERGYLTMVSLPYIHLADICIFVSPHDRYTGRGVWVGGGSVPWPGARFLCGERTWSSKLQQVVSLGCLTGA